MAARRLMLTVLLLISITAALRGLSAERELSLAVVDVTVDGELPTGFPDLLFTKLCDEPGIMLLERDELDAVFRERTAAATLGAGSNKINILEYGKLLNVGAFVMLEALKGRQGNVPVRTRVVETTHGIRLHDSAIVLGPDSNIEALADRLGKQICATVKTAGSDEDRLFIGLTTFRSEEISRQWDWLSGPLHAGISRALCRADGVLLVERERTQSLTAERSLATHFPEALKASSLLVEGAFRIARNEEASVVRVQCHCRQTNGTATEVTASGRTDDLGPLCQELANGILQHVGKATSKPDLNPRQEAELLAREAFAWWLAKDFVRGIGAAEAAVALAPDQPEYRILLVRLLGSDLAKRCTQSKAPPITFLQSAEQYVRAASIGQTLLSDERVLANKQVEPDLATLVIPSRHNPKNLSFSARVAIRPLLSCWPQSSRMPREQFIPLQDQIAVVRSSHRALLAAWEFSYQKIDTHHETSFRFFNPLCPSHVFWMPSARAAADQFIDLIVTPGALPVLRQRPLDSPFSRLSSSPAGECTAFLACPVWPEGPAERRRLLHRVADAMAGTDDKLLHARAAAYRLALAVNQEDHAEAREYFTLMVDMLLDLIPEHVPPERDSPDLYFDTWLYLIAGNTRFAASHEECAAFRAETLQRVAVRAMGIGDPRRIFYWRYTIEGAAEGLCSVGHGSEGVKLLHDAAEALRGPLPGKGDPLEAYHRGRTNRLANELTERAKQHEQRLGITPPQKRDYSWRSLVTLEDLERSNPSAEPPKPLFRRCVATPTCTALVMSKRSTSGERFGIARLNAETRQPEAIQWSGHELPRNACRRDHMQYTYRNHGPTIAESRGVIFVATPWHGIQVFAPDTPVRRLDEKTGLPSNRITQLAVLGEKLYACTGSSLDPDSGVIEVDLENGTSRILWSSRDKEGDDLLNGLPIRGIAADESHGRLWIISGNDATRQRQGHLATYTPRTGKLERVCFPLLDRAASRISGPDFSRGLHGFTNAILVKWHALYLLDLSEQQLHPLLENRGTPFHTTTEWHGRKWHAHRFALVENGLVTKHGRNIEYFQRGIPAPTQLGPYVPKSHDRVVYDVIAAEDGLLVLTSDQLGLMPEIRAPLKRECKAP